MSPRQARQFGGTALFSINKATHRAIEKGQDPSNLGRWSWTRYKGKGNHTLTILVAYRPNPPQGPHTVYTQHNAYFHSINRNICPRRAFVVDLIEELIRIKEQGDHILLLIDGNSNMKNSDLASAVTQSHLKEMILDRHGTSGPATHKRNSTSTPTDGIWASPGLQIDNGGYFGYDEVFHNTDHHCLWIDISFLCAFGHNMPPPCTKGNPKDCTARTHD